MFGYAYVVCLFPHALQGFAAVDMNILELGSTKREEDMWILGKWSIYVFSFLIDLGK